MTIPFNKLPWFEHISSAKFRIHSSLVLQNIFLHNSWLLGNDLLDNLTYFCIIRIHVNFWSSMNSRHNLLDFLHLWRLLLFNESNISRPMWGNLTIISSIFKLHCTAHEFWSQQSKNRRLSTSCLLYSSKFSILFNRFIC